MNYPDLSGSVAALILLMHYFTTFSPDDQLVHPSLFQLLFESQSPQLVPTILSGKRFLILNYTSPLDYFATGYCIAHSDATTSWYVHFDDSPQSFQAFSHGLHYSPTTTYESTIELSLVTNNSLSPYFEIFPSLYPYTQAITVLSLHGGLCSSNESVSVASVLQQLSHYCPRLRKLTLPRLQPLSLVPQLPQLTLEELCLFLPLMKDESVLGHHLQQCLAQCLALNDLTLAPVNKLVMIQFTHSHLHCMHLSTQYQFGLRCMSLKQFQDLDVSCNGVS